MTFGLQEIFDKAKQLGATPERIAPQDLVSKIPQPILTNIEHLMESKHAFDWTEFNLFGTGEDQLKEKFQMTRQDQLNLATAVRNIPLEEFIAKSGAITAAGLQGANYVIPVKIYDIMVTSAIASDITPQVSRAMLGPGELPGTTCNVDVIVDESFHPMTYSSGGRMPESNLTVVQATLDFSNAFGLHIPITQDLIEDQKWGLMEVSLQEAGKEMGEKAADMACTIIGTAPDGDGTLNHGHTNSTSTTLFTGGTIDIEDCIVDIASDGYNANTLITCPHAAWHTIVNTPYNYAEPWAGNLMANGLPSRMAGLDMIYSNSDYLTNSGSPATGCKTLLIDKEYAIITGRKRWLRIEHYSDPIQDLVGATISSRQDSVSLYKDAIYMLSEEAT